MAAMVELGREQLGKVRRSGGQTVRRATVGSRGLPDFLILGAQKAGTTSLHDYLAQHPAVAPPVTKEVHYFDLEHERGERWYRAQFPRARGDRLSGEATPYYLFHPLVPERVRELLPEAKLIVLLRDPIDRAFSHHNHERALGFESLDFELALAAEPARLCGEEKRLRADPTYRSFAHQHYSYLQRGLYEAQLGRWVKCFDREQFLVLSAEKFFAEPGRVVAAAQDFLGLERQPPADLSARNARSYTPISAGLRARLEQEFAPANARLGKLFGRDFGWS